MLLLVIYDFKLRGTVPLMLLLVIYDFKLRGTFSLEYNGLVVRKV